MNLKTRTVAHFIGSILAPIPFVQAEPTDAPERLDGSECRVTQQSNCLYARVENRESLSDGELRYSLHNLCSEPLTVESFANVLTHAVDRDSHLGVSRIESFNEISQVFRPALLADFDGNASPGEVFLSFSGKRDHETTTSSNAMLRVAYHANGAVLREPTPKPMNQAMNSNQIGSSKDSASSYQTLSTRSSGLKFLIPERDGGLVLPSSLADAPPLWRDRGNQTHQKKKGTRFCFKVKTLYDDGGVGESFWTHRTPYSRRLIGNLVFVKHKGEYLFSGALDSKGCTQRFKVPKGSWVHIDVLSAGYVGQWLIETWDIGGDEIPRNQLAVTVEEKDKTQKINLTYSQARNVYLAMAKSIQRRPVSYHDETYKIKSYVGDCRATHYNSTSGKIHICNQSADDPRQQNHITKKFVIAHELGHFVNDFYQGLLGGRYTDYDPPNKNFCDVEGDDFDLENPKGDGGGSSHATTSVEVIGVAIREGFASFYAAEIFNGSKSSVCDMKIGRFGHMNCGGEKGYGYHPMKLMETNCDADRGLGNEVDWTRAFWDLRRRNKKITMKRVISWLYQLKNKIKEEELDDRSVYKASVSVAKKLKFSSDWKKVAKANGVDW